jgi:lysophospholipase L1-like esterase
MQRRDETVAPPIVRLAGMERKLTQEIVQLAEAAGMSIVDPTDELVQALADGVAIYPPDLDAHLNKAGSAIAARALWRAIEAL